MPKGILEGEYPNFALSRKANYYNRLFAWLFTVTRAL